MYSSKRLLNRLPKNQIKSSLYSLNNLSGVTSERCQLRGFAPGLTHQNCSGSESLATCRRFDRLGIWTAYLQH